MTKVILNSGGMDSFLLAMQPGWREAVHVFVDVGQAYREKEARSARHIAENCGTTLREVSGAQIAFFEHPSGIIPYRNAEMILCAAQYGEVIGLGVVADEVNSDKSPAFLSAMERMMDIAHAPQYWTEGKVHRIETPLSEMTKAQHVQMYLSLGGGLEALLATVSCYDGGEHHCGECASCFKRWIALTVATGNPYLQQFNKAPWIAYNADYVRSRMHTYSERRIDETRTAYKRMGIDL